MEFDLNEIISDMDFNGNSINDLNGLLLTNNEIKVLDKYNIDYKNCNSLKDVIFLIEEILNEEEFSDLEQISSSISERDYYQNTNQ